MLDLFTTLHTCLQNLRTNKIRTLLSALGIVIGISSVIALLTIGQSVSDAVIGKVAGLGGNRLTVSVSSSAIRGGISESELESFYDVPGVIGISPNAVKRFIVVLPNEAESLYDDQARVENDRVFGVNTNYFTVLSKNAKALHGRILSQADIDESRCVAVLGYTLSQRLYGNIDPVGQSLRVGGKDFTIVGVMPYQVGLDLSVNSGLLIPFTTYYKVLEGGLPTSFDVIFDGDIPVPTMLRRVSDRCAELFDYGNGEGYVVTDQQELADTVDTVKDLIIGFLVGIAIISLVVGGIGIMNMMLVTVGERTSEIGLRKALGARPSVILIQFLIEAMILSLLGGMIGIGFGIGISYLAARLIGYVFTVNVTAILLATFFSLTVGLLFGILPARRAAKLNPIDALRNV